jgi:hypothetical protein
VIGGRERKMGGSLRFRSIAQRQNVSGIRMLWSGGPRSVAQRLAKKRCVPLRETDSTTKPDTSLLQFH